MTPVLARAAAALRDALARPLVRASVPPNAVSWASLAVAVGSAAALLRGASDPASSPWPASAAALLVLSGTLDVLDGATARASGRATEYGAFLDSTLDRVSDLVVHAALVAHCAARDLDVLAVLAMLAFAHGVLIAYMRSRAEALGRHAPVGFWQRSERVLLLAWALCWGRLDAALVVLATLPALTAWRRFRQVRALLHGVPEAASDAPALGLGGAWLPWRARRGTSRHLATCAAVLAAVPLLPRVA